MDPVTIASLIKGGSDALQGLSSYLSERSKGKLEKKKIKEMKRKTFADLLNESMGRSHQGSQESRSSQREMSGARAKALQDMAANIRQSLVR